MPGSLPLLVLIFAGAAATVWYAGIWLSRTTDVLDRRLHLGEALGGAILLAFTTNLPEVAITVSAAFAHNLGIAIGNILGGIAIQTVVLAVLDVWGLGRRSPLTYQAASLQLVLEGALVVAVLVVSVMGSQLTSKTFLRVEPAAAAIVVIWLAGLWLLSRASRGLPWQEGGIAPDTEASPRGTRKQMIEERAEKRGISTGRAAAIFAVAAMFTLAAGVLLERSGEKIAAHLGMTGVLFGATILAASTALPEVSTGLASIRISDYQLAVSDIFGGNAFLPVLFLVANLISGRAVLPQAQGTDIYLTGLGALLTVVYLYGLVFRDRRQLWSLGFDSAAVVVIYALGIVGLIYVTQH